MVKAPDNKILIIQTELLPHRFHIKGVPLYDNFHKLRVQSNPLYLLNICHCRHRDIQLCQWYYLFRTASIWAFNCSPVGYVICGLIPRHLNSKACVEIKDFCSKKTRCKRGMSRVTQFWWADVKSCKSPWKVSKCAAFICLHWHSGIAHGEFILRL